MSPVSPEVVIARPVIDVLTFTTLFPNREQPRHGLFVEQRLRHLTDTGRVRAIVVAPVPWFPFGNRRFGRFSAYARVPYHEDRNGLEVVHPRYPVLPKVGMTVAPYLLSRGAARVVRRHLPASPRRRAIDAHYFYPDGVAAVMLGRRMRVPVVVTARGSDVNVIARHRVPRRRILWAARHAAAVVTVSNALRDALVDLGVDPRGITVLRNGVDLDFFRPMNRGETRRRLGFQGPTLLSVGNLIESKGHHVAIESLPHLPDVTLVIAGDGEDAARLAALATSAGVADRVRFVGSIPQLELRDYYTASDALVLASSREGMPNVVLESLACGTPVIATAVGGIPEVLTDDTAGVLMQQRHADGLVAAYRELVARHQDRDATRSFAQSFGWGPTTEGQLRILENL